MAYKRDYYVCFRRAKKIFWWQLFTGFKRSHIFLITACNENSCVMIETSEGGTGIYAYDKPALDVAESCKKNGCEVLCYRALEKNMNRPYPKFFRTCVTTTKDFLGIRKWWVVTPNQLYRELSC